MYYTHNLLDKNQMIEFLQKTKTLYLKIQKQNYRSQRFSNRHYFLRTPYIAYHYFFKFCLNPLASKLHPNCSFCYLVSFTECVFGWWYYGFRRVQSWYLSARRILLCVLCNKVSTLLKSDTMWYLVILWFWYHTDTQRHIGHSGVNRLKHPYKYILTRPVIFSEQLCVLHGMNSWLISKIYFPRWVCVSKITHL